MTPNDNTESSRDPAIYFSLQDINLADNIFVDYKQWWIWWFWSGYCISQVESPLPFHFSPSPLPTLGV